MSPNVINYDQGQKSWPLWPCETAAPALSETDGCHSNGLIRGFGCTLSKPKLDQGHSQGPRQTRIPVSWLPQPCTSALTHTSEEKRESSGTVLLRQRCWTTGLIEAERNLLESALARVFSFYISLVSGEELAIKRSVNIDHHLQLERLLSSYDSLVFSTEYLKYWIL